MAGLISKRYATALFDIAKEQGAMDTFKEQATLIRNLFSTESDYLAILGHPTVLIQEKIKMIEDAFSGQVADEFVGLLALVIKKERQAFIIEILDTFIEMAKTEAGIVQGTVISALPLKDEQLAQIKSNIEQKIGGTIELTTEVDKSLIGGMIIRVGDKVVDGSIRGQMETLKVQLNNLRLA